MLQDSEEQRPWDVAVRRVAWPPEQTLLVMKIADARRQSEPRR